MIPIRKTRFFQEFSPVLGKRGHSKCLSRRLPNGSGKQKSVKSRVKKTHVLCAEQGEEERERSWNSSTWSGGPRGSRNRFQCNSLNVQLAPHSSSYRKRNRYEFESPGQAFQLDSQKKAENKEGNRCFDKELVL